VAPTGLVLGFGHGVHLSGLVDTIVAAYAAALKGGMTVRLHFFGRFEYGRHSIGTSLHKSRPSFLVL
jgi:hypothetical protein